MKRILLSASAVLFALILPACASSRAGPQTIVNFDIQNNLIPSSTVTVYLVPEAGIERQVGIVPSGQNIRLQYKGLSPVGEYRLVARTTGNRNIVSNVVVMDNVTGLEWSLATNYLRVTATKAGT